MDRTALSIRGLGKLKRQFMVMLACLLFSNSPLALAALDENTFPQSPTIRAKVRFWEQIFRDTSIQTYVIHDADDPSKIVDIIDFKRIAEQHRIRQPFSKARRQDIADKYVKRYQLAVDRFRQYGKQAVKFGMIEERLYQVYLPSPLLMQKLYAGKIRIRSQVGMKEEFLAATRRAEKFLPFIEAAFREQGLPVELSRLPFVESMFNNGALSKVGASGMWQFIPTTAKHYLHVNQLVDERHNPYKASIAAARLLKDNYRLLGNWPLAVTAYNHGTKGMQNAVRNLGTKDFEKIVQLHRSPDFGFASRNFYAEFVAVNKVYNRWLKEGLVKKPGPQIPLVAVKIQPGMRVADLYQHLAVPQEVIRQYNPEISSKALTSLKYKPLPNNFKIFLPPQYAQIARNSLLALNGARRKEKGL